MLILNLKKQVEPEVEKEVENEVKTEVVKEVEGSKEKQENKERTGSYSFLRKTSIIRADGTKMPVAADGTVTPKTDEEEFLCRYFEGRGILKAN